MKTQIHSVSLVLLVLTAFGFAFSGCAHKKAATGDEGTAAMIDQSDLGSSDDGKAMGLATVHFAYDSNLLDKAAKSQLKQNAEILKSNANLKVQIEGHCDARGGIQYNIALGERRAKAVKAYLEDQGVPGERLTTVSYGKERPLVPGDSEEAYAKNRRANFVLTAK